MDERDPREPQDDGEVEDGVDEGEAVSEDDDDAVEAVGDRDEAEDGPGPAAPPRKLPRYTIHELQSHEDVLGRRFCYNPTGRPVCGRRRRKKKNAAIEDEACMAGPTTQGPCRVHGAGAGAPLTAGGRYSKVLRSWASASASAVSIQRGVERP